MINYTYAFLFVLTDQLCISCGVNMASFEMIRTVSRILFKRNASKLVSTFKALFCQKILTSVNNVRFANSFRIIMFVNHANLRWLWMSLSRMESFVLLPFCRMFLGNFFSKTLFRLNGFRFSVLIFVVFNRFLFFFFCSLYFIWLLKKWFRFWHRVMIHIGLMDHQLFMVH